MTITLDIPPAIDCSKDAPETTRLSIQGPAPPRPATRTPNHEMIASVEGLRWISVHYAYRRFTEIELAATKQFIRFLPVSSSLSVVEYRLLTLIVEPFYQSTPTIVSLEQFLDCYNRYVGYLSANLDLRKARAIMQRMFATTPVLVIGQLEVEFIPQTHNLTLRKNAENYARLLDFIALLDSEPLI